MEDNKKESITELTTSASSGAYETMFGIPASFNNKNLKDEGNNDNKTIMRNIFKESDINRITKKILIESFVVSSDSKMFGKNRENVEGIDAHAKNNITIDQNKKPYKDINLQQTEDNRIEAGQNGLLDISYDNLPPKAEKQMKDAILNGGKPTGSGVPSNVGQQMLDDAKKRNETNPNNNIVYKGTLDDVEIDQTDKSKTTYPRKKILETKQRMKKLISKKTYTNNQLEMALESMLPESYKVDGQHFLVEDSSGTKFKVKWDGSKANGAPVVVESKNVLKEAKEMDKIKRLMNYDPTTSNPKSSMLNENEIFAKIYKSCK